MIFLANNFFSLECNGVMVAQGLLNNPALFQGYRSTPLHCIQSWLDISSDLNLHFTPFHNHLIYMLAKVLSRTEKRLFNSLKSKEKVLEFLKVYLDGEKEFEKPNLHIMHE